MQKTIVFLLIFAMNTVAANEILSENEMIKRFLNHESINLLLKTGESIKDNSVITSSYMKNPELSAGYEQPFSGNDSYTAKLIGIGVQFDINGSYSLKKKAAAYKEKQVEYSIREMLFDRIFSFRFLLNRHHFLSKKYAIMEKMHRDIKVLLSTLDELVTGGERSSFDRNRMRSLYTLHSVEMSRTMAEIAALQEEVYYFTRSVGGVQLKPITVDNITTIMTKTMEGNSALLRQKEAVSKADVDVKVAKREWIPTIGFEMALKKENAPTVSPEYGFELEFMVALPIFDFNREGVAEKNVERIAALFEHEEREMKIEIAVRSHYKKIMELLKQRGELNFSTEKLIDNAFILYREAESSIDNLINTISESEELMIVEVELNEEIRKEILTLYHVAGFFNNKEISDSMREVLQ